MAKNVFDTANDYIRSTESSLVNLLSAVAPWGAPLAPAFMSFIGMTKHLDFTPFVAGVIAGVIEILGLATVHTTLLFWRHNRRYSKEYKKMPTALAGGMFGLYLIVVLSVNVILEAYSAKLITWDWTPIVARGLLSLLAVPAAVTMAIRAQHTELLNEIQGNRKGNQVATGATEMQPQAQPEVAKSNRTRILELHHTQPDLKSSAIAQEVGVSRQYVDKVIAKNGYSK
jgi:hypothetical protein